MTIGILGGGQLARMIGLAGIPFGLQFVVFDPAEQVGGSAIGRHVRASYDDEDALIEFAGSVDVATYEFENVPVHAVSVVEQHCKVLPEKTALHETQDRLRENQLFNRLDIATPRFCVVDSRQDLTNAVETLGYPIVLKTRSGGYDGKGQVVIRSEDSVESGWIESAQDNLLAEEFVPFDREVSIVAARRPSGETVYYDIAENVHRGGILRTSFNRPGDPIQGLAIEYVNRLFDELGYFGVIALECFQVGDSLLANEYAPRVHNTGHWTIEGAEASQFENHVRAVLDIPLGSTASRGYSAMLNCIGALPDRDLCLRVPGVHFHSYDKSARPGRKVGHVTVRADSPADLERRISLLPDFFSGAGDAL